MWLMKISRYHIDLTISFALLFVLGLHYGRLLSSADEALLVAAAFVGTAPVLWGAWRALREHEWASMDMLASVALVFSIVSAQWVSAVFIALMLAGARILGELTQDQTEKNIRGLLTLRPSTAKVERGGTIEVVPVEDVRVGDIVVADIGDSIAVDGEVISGEAAVNESSLTGESLPAEKTIGSKAMSSTIVASGSICIRTDKVGKDTTLERIIALVESSRAEKPKTQTLGERFGKIYLISIFIGSVGLYFFTHNLTLVLAVVLVVCADDVAIAIPLAYLRAIGTAASHGIIVKGGRHLETLGQAQIVVFDKTGTLTQGKLSVADVVAVSGVEKNDVLEAGALAARRSSHPVARALTAYADAHNVARVFPDESEERGGQGIVAHRGGNRIIVGKTVFLKKMGIAIPTELEGFADRESDAGHTISYVARDGVVLGFFAVSDTVKQNASAAVAALKSLGVRKVVMLTGDNERVARTIASAVGIDAIYANLMPEDKIAQVKAFQKEGITIMVGDGVNDAAALAGADVGVAMGALGAEGAIESANIVLMRDDLSTLAQAMRLARSARRVSIEDFAIWGVTNAVGLALVFGGLIGPAGAAAYNFISDFFPLANSLRVRA